MKPRSPQCGSPSGVTALFAGEPGTGKSIAAEVVAAELGLDLCRIDLSQVVDKYIGETEKNLGRLFDDAEASGPCWSSTRPTPSSLSAGPSRTATTATPTCRPATCWRLERYRGLAILTTNLRSNMDEAFTRRITVQVEFPLPDAADRLRFGAACWRGPPARGWTWRRWRSWPRCRAGAS